MKPMNYFPLLFAFFLAFFAADSFGQERPDPSSARRDQRSHYRKSLLIDSAKAEQVVQVQDVYKKALGAVVADSSLSDAGRRAKIQLLIEDKNRKLRGLLTPAQQQKVIPTTERVQAKPSVQR